MKNWLWLFLISFGLNLVWENLHQFLYLHYRGQAISELILLRAALVDGLIIVLAVLVVERLNFPAKKIWPLLLITLAVAVIMERWALATGRWQYAAAMPLLPIIKTGLSPTIQLALSGALAYSFFKRMRYAQK